MFTRGPKRLLYLGLALGLIETVSPLVLTVVLRQIVDAVVAQNSAGTHNWLLIGAVALIFAVPSVMGAFVLSARFVNTQISSWREDINLTVATASTKSINRLASADILSRTGYDVDTAGTLLWTVVREFWKPLILIAATAFVLSVSWKLLLASVILIPALTWLSNRVTIPIGQAAQEKSELIAGKTELYREMLQSNVLVKADGLQPYYMARFGAVVSRLRTTMLTMDRSNAIHGMVFLGLRYPPQLIVPIFGGYLAYTGEISPGALLACYLIMGQIFGPVEALLGWNRQWRAAKPSAERIDELLQLLHQPARQNDVSAARSTVSTLAVGGLAFAYDGKDDTLANVAFELSAGEITLLAGKSGSGKSTLIRILGGLELAQNGVIMLDGVDLSAQPDLLRQMTALVPQDAFLFPMTIRENIRLGRPGATDDDVVRAAVTAYAHSFIGALDDRYDTHIDPRGTNLSGGQKQRICLARAILKNAPILLLDEPTSALDADSEALIHDALQSLASHGKIVLIASHRPATLDIAHRRLLLDDGKVARQQG